MKKFKKLFAVILSLAMVMGMTMTAFATETSLDKALKDDTKVPTVKGYPSNADTATVKITGIVGNATVTVYKIATAEYEAQGFKKFTFVSGAQELDKNQAPTADQITAVANAIKTNSGLTGVTIVDTKTGTYSNGTYQKELPAGAYIAIIEPGEGSQEQYNPIYLTVTYNDQGQVVGGSVVASEDYLWGTTAVAKHTPPKVDKEISGGTETDSTINASGTDVDATGQETASLGDTINYTVKPNPMPSYPQNAKNQTLFISDTMNTGLTFDYSSLRVKLQYPNGTFLQYNDNGTQKDVELTINESGQFVLAANSFDSQGEDRIIGTAAPTKDGVVQQNSEGATGFNINFNYRSLIYDNAGNTFIPVVTYSAVLNDTAVVGAPGLDNKVKLYFASNSVSGSTHEGTTEPNPEEGEGITVVEDEKIVYTYRLMIRKVDAANTSTGLGGAVFGVYKDANCTELVSTMTTDDEGYAISTQIGKNTAKEAKYWVKELLAPEGYQINPDPFTVDVTWATATKKVTTTTTTQSWTTEKRYAQDPIEQVGWVVEENGKKVLKAMDTYTDATAAEEAGAVPAYKKDGKETTSTVEKIEENSDQAGNGVVYGNSEVKNTKLAALPSTGGIGTTIFTIGGCAIMIIAAALFFSSRRKNAK